MYVRRVLTMRRPDGNACGTAIWQERDGEVQVTLQGMRPAQDALRVVIVEPGRAQDAGVWARGETFTASVAPGRGQGVALCGPDGRVTASGFLPGCAQSALALRTRIAHALGLTQEGEAVDAKGAQEGCGLPAAMETPPAADAPDTAAASVTDEIRLQEAGRRTLIFRGEVCIGQRLSGSAWPPPPLAPDAPYRDGAFHIGDDGLTEA